MSRGPLDAAADPARPMPGTWAARLDHARAALGALREEQRRLERLGLETALARCGERIRFWRFVAGLLALSSGAHGADESQR